MKIEEIVWQDHYSTDAWTDLSNQESLDNLVEDIFVTSVGYPIKETRTKVVLVANKGSNGQVFNTITILKKTIKSRTVIRES